MTGNTKSAKQARGAKTAAEGYEQVLANGRKQFDAATKSFDEFAALGKETFEAWAAAGNTSAKGFEAANTEVLAFGKNRAEQMITATKALFAAKSVGEAIEIQHDYAKQAFDAYASETSKLGELLTKTTEAAFAPVNAHYAAAFERLIRPAGD